MSHIEESIHAFRVLVRKSERNRRIGGRGDGRVIVKWGGMELCVYLIKLTQDR
jgi:hypothetical protein